MYQRPNENNRHEHSANDESLYGFILFMFNAIALFFGVSAAPFEVMLRHRMGSRYQHIVVLVLAPIIPMALLIVSMGSGIMGHPKGLIGMGVFYLIQIAFTWKHYLHVFRVFRHPHEEKLSHEDGEPLLPVQALPNGDKWPMVRFVYEPGMLLCTAGVLTVTHIVTPLVGGYMAFGAVALFMRAGFVYYKAWEYVRDILDNFNMTTAVMGGRGNGGSEEAIKGAIEEALKRVPTTVPRQVYNTVLSTAKPSLPSDLQGLINEAMA